MAKIKITVDGPLMDGHKVTFKAPCDCSSVEKLKVCYVENGTPKDRLFTMKDSHGNDLTGLGNLFSKGAYVNVVLDTNYGNAYLQNANTNSYIEGMLRASNGTPFRFGVTENGEYGYIVTDEEGADTVHPFKNLVRDTQATAAAAQITVGYTAWVNGELIVGTRPAAPKTLSGEFYTGIGEGVATYKYRIDFEEPFDVVPEFTYNMHLGNNDTTGSLLYVKRDHAMFQVVHSKGNESSSCRIVWTATVQ